MITISNHKVDGATFQQTPNVSGAFASGQPDTLVIHFTGGRDAQSSANWLCNPKAKASAHLIVGKDGKIIQLADLNVITWHAGKSEWNGRKWLNQYSIGIELDNAGVLEDRVDGYYTWFKTQVPNHEVVKATHRNQQAPSYWQAYTAQQIAVTEQLCEVLMDTYPTLTTIVGHEEISPGRKTDPGPAFPLDSMRNRLVGRRDDEETAERGTHTPTPQGIVTASKLNIRTAPSASAGKAAAPLELGTLVKIEDERGGWYRVKAEIEGWVSKEWVRK